jgi:hypothetical protein
MDMLQYMPMLKLLDSFCGSNRWKYMEAKSGLIKRDTEALLSPFPQDHS